MKLSTVWPVTCHTDHVGDGSTFVAIEGQNLNGVDFIPRALSAGAKKIVVPQDAILGPAIVELVKQSEAELLRVADTRCALAQLSARAFDYPAQKLKIIAITGTKGKTTTACTAYHMLRESGASVALLGTIHNAINGHIFSACLTTPQPDYLHMFFNACVDQGVEYVVMEVAAQAASLHRIHGLMFDAVAFTNFGHEHREFYATFDDYFKAKVQILRHAKHDALIVLNADDARVKTLIADFTSAKMMSIKDQSADFFVRITNIAPELTGTLLCGSEEAAFSCTALFGEFNAANIMCAAALVQHCGVSLQAAARSCTTMPPLPGRLERYQMAHGIQCIIDYAHTPESYTSLLSLLRGVTPHLTVVFGAGGARDASKRPLMGAIAARYADRVILTTDNPRSEDPEQIAADILAGIDDAQKDKVLIEFDREKAIKVAYQLSKKDGIIALLGKGPDEYQLVAGQKIPFSEKAIIKQLSAI